jgi:3-deoxy-D-manno-octulosonate 8-phosphate phosphatase (KDO 8-P phosphatase)
MSDFTAIKLIVFDVDGVFTDGGIVLNDRGEETKRFHVRDGAAIKWAMKLGMQIAVLTGRSSRVVNLRMTELGIEHLIQGSKDKLADLAILLEKTGVPAENTAFMGDDLIDLPAMKACSASITVADGADEAKANADLVTKAKGGHGAVREAIEHIIKAQGNWQKVVEWYGAHVH